MSIATEIQRLQQAKADIKSAIEEKGVTVGDETIDTYAEKISEISIGGSGDYEQGYEDGKNSVQNPLEHILSLYDAYYKAVFPNEYELTLDIPNITNLNSAFADAKGLKKVVLKGNTQNTVLSFNNTFRNNETIETIDFTEFNVVISNANAAWANNKKLIEILGEIDFSPCTSFISAFISCYELVTLTPKPNTIKFAFSVAHSSKLSTDTIQSIIDGLADLTGQTSQTLTVHQDVRNKLTDDQLTTISDKNWAISPAEATI